MRVKRVSEFNSLRQGNDITVIEYAHKFNTLGRFVRGVMKDEKFKMLRFMEGFEGLHVGSMAVETNK